MANAKETRLTMIDNTNIDRFYDLHEQGVPFKDIIATLGITPELALRLNIAVILTKFETLEEGLRCRSREDYEALFTAVAAFINAGQRS